MEMGSKKFMGYLLLLLAGNRCKHEGCFGYEISIGAKKLIHNDKNTVMNFRYMQYIETIAMQ